MMLLAAVLLISTIMTWLGTEYVLNSLVIPLIDDDQLPAPGRFMP
ncbi:conserved hypothetical protein [Bradyrhizobium oligotrophicum S58]|uniref:Uncharacterized protein n=1 Tax=Bradyrhizobium oligotrophicum S58 TaxID=1245469 RepID=M4ZAU9_9BRAD|nr:hypothetical protein [Bradyrhizobium oligotrophicum]BAM90772.1 conserved hypothetical protein [Bradyrhizobium oligotrophicum S58]